MQKYKYKVSVVVPVYNAEEFLEESLDSVINQSIDITNGIQLILINDGSSDNSEKICLKYKEMYPENVLYIKQKNSGVSAARNNGIKNSEGKYIMLLDSDDYISKETIENLFSFYESHYDEVDLVTYTMKFDRKQGIANDPRYNAYDKGTGVYDIEEYIYLNQSTVNIMIKNRFDKNELYDTKMELSEDQNYDTTLIMKKKKIGFVKEATYYYRRHEASVSATRNNPYYCFEKIMKYNEGLLERYPGYKYIQALILNTLCWRISANQLIPYYLENEEYREAVNRIKRLVGKIDCDVIMNFNKMTYPQKIQLLAFSDKKIDIALKKNEIELINNKEVFGTEEYIDGEISRIKVRGSNLYIMGSLNSLAFLKEEPTVYAYKYMNDNTVEKEKLSLSVSNESYYISDELCLKAYVFDNKIDITNVRKIRIVVKLKDNDYDVTFRFKKFASNNFVHSKVNVLYSRKNLCFTIRKSNIINFTKSRLRNTMNAVKRRKKSIMYRWLYYIFRTSSWLYVDSANGKDNGFEQFKHDFDKKDKIKKYYITNMSKGSFDSKYRKYIVKRNSFKHKMLYLRSKRIISSFVDLQVYCPFNTSIVIYNDLLDYDFVYLQHGMLHADLLRMYGKEFTEIEKFIISSWFEEKNLTNKYLYKKDNLIYSGMPRMSNNVSKPGNRILLAPSWRKYLIGDLYHNKRALKEKEFLNSKFYKEFYSFICSDKLQKVLSKNNYHLEFKLHPIFKEYSKFFENGKIDNVDINFNKTNIEDYNLFITDFSSFQFDFVKLKRRIIYFVPDMIEFKAGLHTYRKLDLKYEDAFGKLTYTADELIDEITKSIKDKCAVEKKYLNRMNNFFFEKKDPCEIIYNEIKKI